MAVIAAVSHKGGTGRSVTTANVAYQLAQAGQDVCVVDLDLASPTFGAILGMRDIQAGVPNPGQPGKPGSIGDILANPSEASFIHNSGALRDVWLTDALRGQAAPASYALFPGSKHIGDAYSAPEMREAMDRLIDSLQQQYDIVYLDLRSGASELLASFRSADGTNEARACDMWLVHFRWTKQHLVGLEDVLEMLNGDDQSVDPSRQYLIKTAFVEPSSVQPAARQAMVRQQHNELTTALNSLYIGPHRASDSLLGEVPLEPFLQWREGIITRADAERGLAGLETFTAFNEISKEILQNLDV